MVIMYDGYSYDGWQRQKTTKNTIQGNIEEAINKVVGEEVKIIASGRTDAKVHAKGQVANFRTNTDLSVEKIKKLLNEKLPESIGIIAIEEVEDNFHSRFNAVGKKYQYTINNSEVENVFRRNYMYRFPEKINVSMMELAAKKLVGKHDFRSFTTDKNTKKSSIREIYSIAITKNNSEITVTIEGNGFMYNMVRIIVGTLIEIGQGRRTVESIDNIFEEKRRGAAGFTAPPQGLMLLSVRY